MIVFEVYVANGQNEKQNFFLLVFPKSENVGNFKVIYLRVKYIKDFSFKRMCCRQVKIKKSETSVTTNRMAKTQGST